MEWFVQLHKKIKEWEWYTDVPTCKLFFHILLSVNYKEAQWRWNKILPGQFITSIDHLSNDSWLSKQQVRTSLDKLISTKEVSKQATNNYTILTLNNWDIYNTPDNKQITNEQQTDNKRITTTNKYNKENKEYKENNIDISKDIWEQALVLKEEFWNNEINELLELIKWQVESLWLLYKKWKYERERAKNIITGKEFWEVCERSNMSRIEFCKNIILISVKLTFWNWKINNAETLYKHYAQVYNDAKNKKSEMETPKRIFTSV